VALQVAQTRTTTTINTKDNYSNSNNKHTLSAADDDKAHAALRLLKKRVISRTKRAYRGKLESQAAHISALQIALETNERDRQSLLARVHATTAAAAAAAATTRTKTTASSARNDNAAANEFITVSRGGGGGGAPFNMSWMAFIFCIVLIVLLVLLVAYCIRRMGRDKGDALIEHTGVFDFKSSNQ
jgi:hypothetical protein